MTTTARPVAQVGLLAPPMPLPPLAVAESARMNVVALLPQQRRIAFGQFMTPARVARQASSMFEPRAGRIRLLDAGAGAGALTAATVERLVGGQPRPEQIHITAFEIDPTLAAALECTLRACKTWAAAHGVDVTYELRQEDFLLAVAAGTVLQDYNAAVLNPPYRKLAAGDELNTRLAAVGLESTNLYTSFWSAVLRVVAPMAQVVAITPRSFCNGTYFRRFRQRLLSLSAVGKLHVYDSRQTAFADDEVLQEIVITAVTLAAKQGDVLLSFAAGPQDQVTCRSVPFEEVVHADDPNVFIRVPTGLDASRVRKAMACLGHGLSDLGLTVSTGRVVDFRAREFLHSKPGTDLVPLIYPAHMRAGAVHWPIAQFRKYNAIANCTETRSLLVPNGTYVLVRRFSAKEEVRRVVAAVYPGGFDAEYVGFENHLNYFHDQGKPLDPATARGLAMFLNSTLVDDFVRQFNGHTQVNAGDLRSILYPSLHALRSLASDWRQDMCQEEIDLSVYALTTE